VINIQAVLTGQRYSPPMQGSGNLNLNQTNTHCIGNVQNISTAGLALPFGHCSTHRAALPHFLNKSRAFGVRRD